MHHNTSNNYSKRNFDKESLFLRALCGKNAPKSTIKGIGDDGVVLSKPLARHDKTSPTTSPNAFATFAKVIDSAREFVIANDGFCEGIHFKREWLSLEQIAKKAMLVNISDMVAMNARPKYALASILLPPLKPRETLQIAHSLREVAQDFGIAFIGGDTMSGDRLEFHITVFGTPQGKLLFRKGLQKGDLLFCTGRVGESLKSLQALSRGQKISKNSKRFSCFVAPALRADFVKSCARFLHCGLDISDGVYAELNRLSAINHLGFCLAKKSSVAKRVGGGKSSDKSGNKGGDKCSDKRWQAQKPLKSSKVLPRVLQKSAYLSGEEYEMLFSISPKDKLALLRKAKQTRTPLCFIGTARTKITHFTPKIWH